VRAHGDGVRDLAVRVTDAAAAYEAALERGATGVRAPWSEDGVARATIATYGETQPTFVERPADRELPGFTIAGLPPAPAGPAVGLRRIDHCVGNVEKGALDTWVGFYRRTLGFDQLVHFGDDAISTEYSALMSTVV